jgi:hypothetical protein
MIFRLKYCLKNTNSNCATVQYTDIRKMAAELTTEIIRIAFELQIEEVELKIEFLLI